MLATEYPYYLANRPVLAQQRIPVTDKYSGKTVTAVCMADSNAIEKAIQSGINATPALHKMAAYERQAILEHCVKRFTERSDELANILTLESGKTVTDAKREVNRLIGTFRLAAQESVQILGEIIPLDVNTSGKGYTGFWKRVPIGLSLFITPFNFPLNLPAHKIAPAIAVGCPFILKPASLTPISALIIGEILAETELPLGAFSILPCDTANAEKMVEDPRFKLLSFTGSAKIGWALKTKAGKKGVILELGGNASCIIDDTNINNLEAIAERLVFGAFYQSGQSCISVQHIMIHENCYAPLREKLLQKVTALKMGDPQKVGTVIGPMISEKEAKRVETWIQAAVQAGAKLLTGGKRQGVMVNPTLLENVPKDQTLYQEEAFGPVALLSSFSSFEDALKSVNESRYGLQTGVFTNNIHRTYQAWESLEVGGVIINDVPAWRADNMPYGGVKDSGLGREGVRFAMDHLTEIRLMVVKTS